MSTTPNLCSVETKIHPGFVCEHRPLKEGETPKRRGQATVYEATGAVTPELAELLDTPHLITIKHDGQCSKLVHTDTGIRVYRRLDVRKDKRPPDNSVPAGNFLFLNPQFLCSLPLFLIFHVISFCLTFPGLNSQGEVEFYWVDITNDNSADNQYYHSALIRHENQIKSIAMIVPTASGGFEIVETPVSDIETGTYELIGPKVQGNPYRLPATKVPVPILRKEQNKILQVEQHFFIRHGIVDISQIFRDAVPDFNLESVRNFIVSRMIEGIVLHFPGKCMVKVNRGHIGVELTKDDVLQINISK
eukprot:TRINITY_DN1352_c0_g1_i5.p2 TRINITY_DN1352_c0_g1~~TRINITY_DN1352_c0_g1_i5.p2  ORF type:complete len:304 (-),score=16.77 TRINITY_DN1352_c0_g1_i5:1080-1991(-)